MHDRKCDAFLQLRKVVHRPWIHASIMYVRTKIEMYMRERERECVCAQCGS